MTTLSAPTFLALQYGVNSQAAATEIDTALAGGDIAPGSVTNAMLAAGALQTVVKDGAHGVGYATGAGGTVTQLVAKTSGVTLNALTGTITLANSALAGFTASSFTWTNSALGSHDVIAANIISSAVNPGVYGLQFQANASSATVWVANNSSGSLTEAPIIQFVVLKGAVA